MSLVIAYIVVRAHILWNLCRAIFWVGVPFLKTDMIWSKSSVGYYIVSFFCLFFHSGGAAFAPPPSLLEESKPMTPPPNPGPMSQPPDDTESGFTIEGKG